MICKRKTQIEYFHLAITVGLGIAVADRIAAGEVKASPSIWGLVINASEPGDTIDFAAGNYPVHGTVNLPSGRTYVGNGATFTGDGTGNDILSFANTSNVDFSGFVLNGVAPEASLASGLNFHNNAVENLNFSENGMHDSHVNNNSFTNSGIMGGPASNNTFDDNLFTGCWEPIHLTGFGDVENTDVSGNVVTGAVRYGFELQGELNNLTVKNNWIGNWGANAGGGHMALSVATGEATNVTISNNALLLTGQENAQFHWTSGCVEVMGKNVTVSNNYAYGWSSFILNGSAPSGMTSTNNVIVGVPTFSAGDNVNPPAGPIASTGDVQYALNDPKAPPLPAQPGTQPPATQPTTAPSSTGVAAPKNVTVAAGTTPGTILATWSAGDGTPTIYIYPTTTGAAGAMSLGQLPAGATSATIGNINNTWHVTVLATFTAAGVESAKTASPDIQVMGGPAAELAFNPSLVPAITQASSATQTPTPAVSTASVQATQPSVTHTISVFSDGSVSVK